MTRRVLTALAMMTAVATSPARAWDGSSTPVEPWTFHTFRLTYGYTFGQREGIRTMDGARVSVPYAEHAAGFEYELEHYDARRPGHQDFPDFLGVALGARMVARIGGVALSQWDAPPAGVTAAAGPTGWAAPVRFSFGAGTLAQLVRATEFVLALHFSIEFLGSRSTWSEDVALAFYPGLRMVWQPSPVRLQLGYDILPIWVGPSRLEHRASVAVAFQAGSVGLGVRFFVTYGEERRAQRGLPDLTLGGALELVL